MRAFKPITCRNCGRLVGELAYDDSIYNPDMLDSSVAFCGTCTFDQKELIQHRNDALLKVDTKEDLSILIRAEALVILDEINLLRDWITQFMAATAAATSLADFKTRVAALPSVPQRNASQIRTAIKSKINAGDADQ